MHEGKAIRSFGSWLRIDRFSHPHRSVSRWLCEAVFQGPALGIEWGEALRVRLQAAGQGPKR